MQGIYLFTAVVGWLFVAFFLFFGGEVDADIDLDVDLDVDVDLTAGEPGLGDALLSFLSFRNIVFFAAFFGATGLALTLLDVNGVITFLLALGVGTFAAYVNISLMRYLRRTSSNSAVLDRDVAGKPAEVVLPIAKGRKGRVAVTVGGQRLYFVALPFDAGSERSYGVGDAVVVIEIDRGAAKVAAMDVLE